MGDGEVRVVALDSPGAGQITVIYTSERLEKLDGLSAGGDGGVTDEHGRPLQILYGLVTRDRLDGDVHPDDLAMSRRESLASYRRFLADEPRFGVDRSSQLELRGVTAPSPPLPEPPQQPPPLPPSPPGDPGASPRRLLPWVGGGVAAIVVAGVLWALLTPPKPNVRVVAIGAQPPVGSCTQPVALTASITTDRATTVR